MSPLRSIHPLVVCIFAAGLASACVTLALRHRAEARYRAVELVVDYEQLHAMASATGHPTPQALIDFRAAGIRGVALTEEVLQDLPETGRVRFLPGSHRATGEGPGIVEIPEAELYRRVRAGLERWLPQVVPARWVSQGGIQFVGPGGQSFEVPFARWSDLEKVPIGLSPQELREVRQAHLDPVARLYNFIGATPISIRSTLATASAQGVRTVIFAEEEVLGFQGRIEDTASALRETGIRYGSVEFGKQRGDEALSSHALDQLIRVHSISAAEMSRLSPSAAIDRYSRGAEERNIRICYVRLTSSAGRDPYRDNLRYVHALSSTLELDGFALTVARPLGEWRVNAPVKRTLRAGVGAAVGAAFVMLVACCVQTRRKAQVWPAVLCALAGAAGMQLGTTAQKAVALAAAIILPTLAFALLPQPLRTLELEQPARRHPIGSALVQFLVMCGISIAGGLLVAAALSERPFMLKVESFAGIKLAHVVPLIAVAVYYVLGLGADRSWTDLCEGAVHRYRSLVGQPLLVGQAFAFFGGVAVLAILVVRTGNEPGVGVSDLEMHFRTLLEQHLVRPRTKEFLVGHPALLLGLWAAGLPAWRRFALPLMLVGAIGQASIVNSFCHIHTPILTSVLRTINGIWLGAAIGLLLFATATLIGRWVTARRSPPLTSHNSQFTTHRVACRAGGPTGDSPPLATHPGPGEAAGS